MCHTVSHKTHKSGFLIYAKQSNWANINLTMKQVAGKQQQQQQHWQSAFIRQQKE